MNTQEAFDRAARGVIKQGKPSSWFGCCQYLTVIGDETLRCGVGHLLPDELTCQSWDNTVGALVDYCDDDLPDRLAYVGLGDLPLPFLVDLQKAHDQAHDQAEAADREHGKDFLTEFRANMATVAANWELDAGAVQ